MFANPIVEADLAVTPMAHDAVGGHRRADLPDRRIGELRLAFVVTGELSRPSLIVTASMEAEARYEDPALQLNNDPELKTDEAVPLRLATWNLNHWRQPTLPTDTRRAAWKYLTGTIRAHVALVQEAVPPLGLDPREQVYGEMAGHRNWGSAVIALDPEVAIEALRSVRIPWSRRRFLLTNTHPGSVAIAQLTVPGIQAITLVSVYGVLDGSAVSTMLRVIADLVPLFDSPYGSRVILGGDLNVSTATTNPISLARAEAVLEAIRSLGLVDAKGLVAEQPRSAPDCSCGQGGSCGHVATWGKDELDHLFVSPSLAGQVVAVSVDPAVAEAGLSDHAPLILDLMLSREHTPHGWDEESFAEEIGRRHGAASRDVIEKLVNWADQKERELAASTGVRTKTLTRFPTNGSSTEPEMWCQVDLDLEPKGIQSTISVRARGDVVVQFGNMRHPPFDAMPVRNELRLALNEIEGVEISEGDLSGWPSFRLSSVEDPAGLARLVAVLDRIAVETHAADRNAPTPSVTGQPVGSTVAVSEPSTTEA
jgi:endonuclease/exonuclease/phosphatase family metal-dependent hydrolase